MIDALALHQGTWQSVFVDYSLKLDTLQKGRVCPVSITFERPEPDLIRQTNSYPEQEPLVWEYRTFAGGLVFFTEGSFSNGTVQLAPFSVFGVEQGFLVQDQKVRLVQLFDDQGRPDKWVWIWEQRNEPLIEPTSMMPFTSCVLQGEATIWTAGESLPTHQNSTTVWNCTSNQIQRQQTILPDWSGTKMGDSFNSEHYNLMMLPGGIYSLSPLQLPQFGKDKSFYTEMGWWMTPTVCLRLIRIYNTKGAWHQAILIREVVI